jgi:Tol biopolymer transport system component
MAAGALLYFSLTPSPQPLSARPLVPLTSDPGREIDPAISPDGSRVAYLASSDTGYDLFVRDMDGGAPLRLTRSRLTKGHPAWSPDGDRLAFVAAEGTSAAIYLLSMQGGQPAKLIDLPSWSFGLDWSPDGRTLTYVDAAPGEASAIVLLDIQTGAQRPIARSASLTSDVKPVFSPDGRSLAFIRGDPHERQRVAVVDVQRGGEGVLLAAPPQQLRGLDWTPDGTSVIISARSGRRFGLWRLPVDGRTGPDPLPVEGAELFNPSVSRDGRIVVEEVEQDRDVWLADFDQRQPAPLVRSTFDDFEPSFAPRDAGLAFVSERSGTPEIWFQSPAGDTRQLTRLSGPNIGHVAWSPDGARLTFATEENGVSSVYALGVASGEPVRLVGTSTGAVPVGWSAAGDALFLLAPTTGGWRLEEYDVAQRTTRPVDAPILRRAAVASDGLSLFAVPAGENKLLQLVEEALGTAIVHRLDVTSGAMSIAARLDHFGGGGLSLGPGGGSVAYTQGRETSNDLAWTQL